MDAIKKVEIDQARTSIAKAFPGLEIVSWRFEQTNARMGLEPVSETIRGLRMTLFLADRVQGILVEDVTIRGQKQTFQDLDSLNKIKKDASELLSALQG